ncbi:inositol-pentakisphosphate 2-kinase-like isoform X1 [Ostrinia furnacalis]|uniref:inositol-pentakisphosphate 2-kinase-like isoform X1 n=1 Tax=Ostrinia furnacalis TaxID=93504 RepID=UPI00103E542C|nr:inositol-pentakisphosphate 2-kinase-like isoform X1 [Ostrinia furnacalis]
MSLLGKSWKYINEGNAHIVIKIESSKYVLRLIKEERETTSLKCVTNTTEFVNKVMIPLLTIHDNVNYDIIEISENDLIHLLKRLEDVRPIHRKIKSNLSCYAIRAPNLLIIGPQCVSNYCIEIKPKEGFIPSTLKNSSKCFYCLKQYVKLNKGQIDSISEYCPLDLFSGNKERMKSALLSLMDNPQNNFKFFRNEVLVFNETSSVKDLDEIMKDILPFSNSTHLFIDFVIAILLSSNEDVLTMEIPKEMSSTRYKNEKCTEGHELPADSFLYKLLRIQKLSEKYNVDSESFQENTDYVSEILNYLDSEKIDLSSEMARETFFTAGHPLHLAMISAIAKDCSIMISFTFDVTKGLPIINIGGNKASYRIAVTDLEPKSTKTLMKRKKNEKMFFELYKSFREIEQ